MKQDRRFVCVLLILILILLMPLSVAAAERDQNVYSELFKNGTHEEWKQAFLDDPRLFVSVLSEEKYGVMTDVAIFTFTPEDVEKNGDRYRQILLTLAQQNKLNQAERRVVRWMLNVLGAEYDMWTEAVDYRELFSRCAEMDGALPSYYSEELEEVFRMDPYRFLQEMADSDVDKEHLATILMDRIYHCNHERQKTEALLRSMKQSGKLNDAQLQMIRKLWQAEGELIGEYGLPLDIEPSTQPESPTDTTEPTAVPTDATAPKEPARKEANERIDWFLPSLGIGILLITAIVIIYIRRKKVRGSARN